MALRHMLFRRCMQVRREAAQMRCDTLAALEDLDSVRMELASICWHRKADKERCRERWSISANGDNRWRRETVFQSAVDGKAAPAMAGA